MSSRPQFSPFYVILDGNMATSLTSKVTIIQKLSLISYSISWIGTSPVGTMSVEVSNDFQENSDGSIKNAGTWTALPLDVSAPVSGNADHGFIDIDLQAAYAMRLVYTRTSGTGLMRAVIASKVS